MDGEKYDGIAKVKAMVECLGRLVMPNNSDRIYRPHYTQVRRAVHLTHQLRHY